MRQLIKPLIFSSCCLLAVTMMSSRPAPRLNKKTTVAPKIQAAILLDVSNSMDGLIEQAKIQLWNMVSTMGKAQCENNVSPQIEIALYEYGRPSNDVKNGYIKQINTFTTDLDGVSKNLFALKTNGGDEYCGHVIYSSLKELNWDASSASYKVIFIAGNEDFLQGDIAYTKACAEAKSKGVIVNTIYCGPRAQGIAEHWNLNAECGEGSFTNINQDAKIEDIATPYDSVLFTLNDKLNGTYISYGYAGAGAKAMQAEVDQLNTGKNKAAAAKRIGVKSNAKLYKNSNWDLVDKDTDGSLDAGFFKTLDKKTLPDSLQNKTEEQIRQVVTIKQKERSAIQQEIQKVNAQRDEYIAAERKKNATKVNENTLEIEVEKMIKVQARRFNMKID